MEELLGDVYKMKNKTKIIGIIGLMILSSLFVVAYEQVEGGWIITQEEYQALTNQQIANYMLGELVLLNYEILPDKLIVYYGIVLIEPTHVNDTYNINCSQSFWMLFKNTYYFVFNIHGAQLWVPDMLT